MKNIQVIDGADNCAYDIFAAADEDFALIFPDGRNIEFIDDFTARVGEARAGEVLSRVWARALRKADAHGIHGTLFYELDFKRKYYPNKHERDLDGWARAGRIYSDGDEE